MGFFDLNLPYETTQSSKSTRIKLVIKAMELGYTGIAYNHTIKGVMSDRDRCSILPFSLSSLLNFAPSISSSVNLHRDLLGVPRSSPFRQYTRLTVCVDNPAKSQALNSGNSVLKTYDIVAVRPLNQIAFDHACQKSEVDIISVDFSEKLPFRLKQPMVKAAIQRGVYFEITYSDLIVDVQVRRQMISSAKLLVDWTRGRNIILSSGAPSVSELRGPCDVANLSSLLGLSTERAKAAISKNCRNLIAIALRKKHFHKDTIRVELMPSDVKSDPKEPLSLDWLKWDPISSGGGDLQLEDIAKSFSATTGVSGAVVKAIDFTSVIDSISSHGGSLFSAFKAVDAPVATTQMSEKLSGNDHPDTDSKSLCSSSSKNQILDDKSSKVACLLSNAAKSAKSGEIRAPASVSQEEPKNSDFPDSLFPIHVTQKHGLLAFPSCEVDATSISNKDTISQGSATHVGLTAAFVPDNKVKNLSKDLTFDSHQVEKIIDSDDLNSVPGSEHVLMNGCVEEMVVADQDNIPVTDDVSGGEIRKSVAEVSLVDNLPFSLASGDIKAMDVSSVINQDALEEAAMEEKKPENVNSEKCNEVAMKEQEYRDASRETQEEMTVEKEEHEALNEQTLEELVTDEHENLDTEIVLGVDTTNLGVQDDSCGANLMTSMEVELKKQKHEEANTQSNLPALLPSLPGKSKVKARKFSQPHKFPLSRMLNLTPFKRKSRKSKHRV
ncbi:Polymerase/histidinol phosphatase-like [Euphorbia peplus]|nr:Polymerase/histidinol phosphatase-like [Euphorbia peplus]